MIVAALAVIVASSAFLFVYGINLLYLSWRATRLPAAPVLPSTGPEARVVVQLPVFNERYVAERVIDAACGLDWPRDRLEVQVLDDSDDDTPEIVARRVERWRLAGVAVTHLRRRHRAGYKAGALANGLLLTSAPFVAVFDADFMPRPDFLRRVMPALSDPRVGFVQARWGHLNEGFSLFTYLQSLMTDFHFLVEQAVRPWLGHFTNFAGSAGVWRRAAIEDAGGWLATTLTEDLDLSYRVQLRGWKPVYMEDVVVPQELPVSASAYRGQQSRWATGSFQCAARLLWPLVRSRLSAGVKFQAALRLLGYAAPVAMLAQIGSYPLILVALAHGQRMPSIGVPLVASFMSLAPPTGMAVAQWRRGREWWWHWYGLIGWTVLGAGTSLTVVASIWRAVRGGGEFKRTPKYRIERLGEEWRSKAYFKPALLGPTVELLFGLAGVVLVAEAVRYGQPLLGVYAGLFTAGFLYLSGVSLVQSLRQVRYEVVAVRVRAVLPRLQGLGLLVAMGLGLLLVAQLLPDPFEDSYQHWLIAANLATTGRLQDPLFQMQDTWLPAYHVLGALVLHLFGTWQLGALKSLDALIGVATLAITYRLAGTHRRGLIAVALLALNPIFVLTATSAVAEPLLVLFLLAAVAAANERRLGMATILACLACLTGTKSWLWLGCVLAVLGGESFLRGAGSRGVAHRLAWVAPALALALTLQATFGFASHSVARAAVEVGSATVRGSLSASPFVRGKDFLGYFTLASLPLVALAPFGLAAALRSRRAVDRSLLLVAWPSLLYLALVTALVVSGVYSGSHRYYYLALPGLALAAAAAADRLRMPSALVPVGAAAVVAAAFVPVLNGLAADNRGLRSAGDSAAALPGALLTDSPTAAFWSRKPPAAIYGSRVLPSGESAAVSWLQSHAVGGLVLEDIDYYRAYSVLPDLTRGQVAEPFVPVGKDPGAFSVPGGKRVHVYELGPVSPLEVAPGIRATVELDNQPARGKTAPLAKGAVLLVGQQDVTGEGMGFGIPIVQYSDGWHYPGHAAVRNLSTSSSAAWRKTFDLDTVGGDAAHGYRFEPAPSVGRVEVTYRVSAGQIKVEVRVLSLNRAALKVGVFNEQSAAFDDFAYGRGSSVLGARRGSDFGPWQTVSGDWARLRSNTLGVEWEQQVAGNSELQAGRESAPPDFDWSGLDYIFGPDFRSVDYTVTIGRAP